MQDTSLTTIFLSITLLEAATFFLMGALHLGAPGPLLSLLHEPRIIDATVVEWTCGLLAIGTFALATGKRWARGMTIIAHAISSAGFFLAWPRSRRGKGRPRFSITSITAPSWSC